MQNWCLGSISQSVLQHELPYRLSNDPKVAWLWMTLTCHFNAKICFFASVLLDSVWLSRKISFYRDKTYTDIRWSSLPCLLFKYMPYKHVRCELRSVSLRIVIRRICWIRHRTDYFNFLLGAGASQRVAHLLYFLAVGLCSMNVSNWS